MLKIFRADPPSRWTDETLLARYAADGDLQYLGVLYERYMPMVYGVCMKILRDSGRSEDAVMAIFEELTLKARTHKVESFRGWLYVLARNHCLMEWRKDQRHGVDLKDAAETVWADTEMPVFELEQAGDALKPLEKCMEALPEQQRLCVEAFYYQDKSYKEIAETMAEDLGKVRSYIQNGRRNLKICLENQGIRNAAF